MLLILWGSRRFHLPPTRGCYLLNQAPFSWSGWTGDTSPGHTSLPLTLSQRNMVLVDSLKQPHVKWEYKKHLPHCGQKAVSIDSLSQSGLSQTFVSNRGQLHQLVPNLPAFSTSVAGRAMTGSGCGVRAFGSFLRNKT